MYGQDQAPFGTSEKTPEHEDMGDRAVARTRKAAISSLVTDFPGQYFLHGSQAQPIVGGLPFHESGSPMRSIQP